MASHKDFMNQFQESIPSFLHDKAEDIYKDILEEVAMALKSDGVEFRGYFSMHVSDCKQRNIIKFKDLIYQQLLEQE